MTFYEYKHNTKDYHHQLLLRQRTNTNVQISLSTTIRGNTVHSRAEQNLTPVIILTKHQYLKYVYTATHMERKIHTPHPFCLPTSMHAYNSKLLGYI